MSRRWAWFTGTAALFCVVLSNVGCAPAEAPSGSSQALQPRSPVQQFSARSEEEAQRLIREARVSCAPEGCSPSVGMLVLRMKGNGVASCTASLVGNDLLLTNSHCIPEELRAPGSACAGRIRVLFPESQGFAAWTGECSQVVKASEITDDRKDLPDYAFLRLSSPAPRPTLQVSRAGVESEERLDIHRVTPQSHQAVIGKLEKLTCHAVQGSILLPDYDRPGAPTISLGDCPIVHGNSGSPALDGNGKVRAVIYATFNASNMGQSDTGSAGPRLKIRGGEQASDLALATNLACVSVPGSAESKGACQLHSDPSARSQVGRSEEELSSESEARAMLSIQKQFGDWEAGQGELFRWRLVTLSFVQEGSAAGESSVYLVAMPRCLNQPAEKRRLTQKLAMWKVSEALTPYLQPIMEVSSSMTTLPVQIEVSEGADVTVRLAGAMDPDSSLFAAQLSRCTDDERRSVSPL